MSEMHKRCHSLLVAETRLIRESGELRKAMAPASAVANDCSAEQAIADAALAYYQAASQVTMAAQDVWMAANMILMQCQMGQP